MEIGSAASLHNTLPGRHCAVSAGDATAGIDGHRTHEASDSRGHRPPAADDAAADSQVGDKRKHSSAELTVDGLNAATVQDYQVAYDPRDGAIRPRADTRRQIPYLFTAHDATVNSPACFIGLRRCSWAAG